MRAAQDAHLCLEPFTIDEWKFGMFYFIFNFFALLNIFLQLDSLDYGNYDDQGP